MIGRALVGAVAAAVAMFILGFIFFATPIAGLGLDSVPDAQAAAVQASLAQSLPETGTYSVPSGLTSSQTVMYGQGPIATIHYNSRGYAIGDAQTMIAGFVHMLVVALLLAAALGSLSRFVPRFGEQTRLLVLAVLAATVFMRLGEPVRYHHDWTYAIYLFVTDTISLLVAGLIILKLLPRAAAAPAGARAES
ncbi:MAG TPA: hypothetical protein VGD19_10985 [Allosphingosinicella sp.]|jgi:hypothetical protein